MKHKLVILGDLDELNVVHVIYSTGDFLLCTHIPAGTCCLNEKNKCALSMKLFVGRVVQAKNV